MTTREELMSVVEALDDDQVARLLGYAEELVHRQHQANGAVIDPPEPAGDSDEDELTNLVPKAGFAPGSGLWNLIGFIKDDGPTDMSTNKHKYLAEAYADLHEE